jgi:hypothetical protein
MTISFRRLLSRLTTLAALSTASVPVTADAATDKCEDAELDANLVLDRGPLDARDAGLTLGRGLALALDEMRPITATHLAATWALSDDPVRRLALAHALEWSFPLVGDGMVLDHLSRDPDPAVRTAVARAAWVRQRHGQNAILSRLAGDPDPAVRAVAAMPAPGR